MNTPPADSDKLRAGRVIGVLILTQIAALTGLGAMLFPASGQPQPSAGVVAGTLLGVALALAALLFWAAVGRQRQQARVRVAERAAIADLLDVLNRLGNGDLTAEATTNGTAIAPLAVAVNRVAGHYRDLVAYFVGATDKLATAACDAQARARQLTDFTSWHAREMAVATAAGRDLATTLGQISATANDAAATGRTLAGATDRVAILSALVAAQDARIQTAMAALRTLAEDARQLGDSALLANDCGDHTRMLALNAAIQAAELIGVGGGFSVIASDLQRLGERSVSVAHSLGARVRGVQAGAAAALAALDRGADHGAAARPAQVDTAVGDVKAAADQLARRLHSVALVARHQLAASGQMTRTLGSLQQAAVQTLTAATHTLAASADLVDFATEFRDTVDDFSAASDRVPALGDPGDALLTGRGAGAKSAARDWHRQERSDPADQHPRLTTVGADFGATPAAFPFEEVFAESSAAMAALDAQAHAADVGEPAPTDPTDGETAAPSPRPVQRR